MFGVLNGPFNHIFLEEMQLSKQIDFLDLCQKTGRGVKGRKENFLNFIHIGM